MVEFTLNWSKEYDDHDNTILEAASPYTDGCYAFRITQVLEDDTIKYTLDTSDAEVVADSEKPTRFNSWGDAKEYAMNTCNQIMREAVDCTDEADAAGR